MDVEKERAREREREKERRQNERKRKKEEEKNGTRLTFYKLVFFTRFSSFSSLSSSPLFIVQNTLSGNSAGATSVHAYTARLTQAHASLTPTLGHPMSTKARSAAPLP